MKIFEITIPGSRIDIEWEDMRIRTIIELLKQQFIHATLALDSFTVAREKLHMAVMRHPAQIDQREHQHNLGIIDDDNLPFDFVCNLPVFYAQAFVQALDTFEKLLGKLTELQGVPVGLGDIHRDVARSFPDLRMLRNSIQHKEDRVLRKAFKRLISTIGKKHHSSHKSLGDAYVLQSLAGNNFCMTFEDGRTSGIEVSDQFMQQLQRLLQSTLDAFTWEGEQKIFPNRNRH